ncbi:ExbD/TolR family protein [Paucibacter sp. JuS9]|uniref:ExbD/TolR family protein n=1 Tax=Paucibacter sp. JuS9 TaxID=3228748 RepID=UPI0037577A98
MAFGRLERSDLPKPMGEINMTPLIDVMLVLLVIFMITAPLMSSSLRMDLPQSAAGTPSDAPQFLAVAITPDGSLYIGDSKVGPAEFQVRIKAQAQARPDTEVQLRADKAAPYGQVAELIGWVQAGGLNRIAFVTETPAAP